MRVWLLLALVIVLPLVVGMASINEALFMAVSKGQAEEVEILLLSGADVNVQDNRGTVLHMAAHNGNSAMVKLLMKHGADVNAPDKGLGNTPLHWAAYEGHSRVVAQLLAGGTKINVVNKLGHTPLHVAAMKGHAGLVDRLLEGGAEVDAVDENKWTPLSKAVLKGHASVVERLLSARADIGIRDRWGAVALHLAVEQGNLEVVQMLLAHDAYVGVKDDEGRTALDLARNKGRASVVQLLEQAAAQQQAVAKGPASSHPSPRPILRRSDVDSPIASKTKSRPNAYAVVVGIEGYRSNLPKADFSAQDAKMMGEYMTNVMGYQAQNVALLLNDHAAKADIQKYIEHWLPNRVEVDATVFVYFSGHGAPNPRTRDAYLVPFDGDPAFMEATGYPLTRLYEQLNKLPAKEIIVVLDACFSGVGGRSVIAEGLRPIVTEIENPLLAKGKTIVLTASAGPQVSSTYEEKAHGLLTYFFLKGLQGEGDTNNDGTIELAELFHYLKPRVEGVARRDFNNDQTPQLLGSAGVLGRGVRLVERSRP